MKLNLKVEVIKILYIKRYKINTILHHILDDPMSAGHHAPKQIANDVFIFVLP